MKQRVMRAATDWRTWTALGMIMLGFLLWRNGKRWWQQMTTRDQGNYEGQESVTSNPVREGELKQMAQDTYTALNSTLMLGGTTATGREWQLERIYALNDTELRWVAKRYEQLADGMTLHEDLDREFMPFTDVDERLIARLQQLAL